MGQFSFLLSAVMLQNKMKQMKLPLKLAQKDQHFKYAQNNRYLQISLLISILLTACCMNF